MGESPAGSLTSLATGQEGQTNMRLRKAEQGREEVGSGTHLPLKLQTAQSRVAVLAKAVCLLSALFSAGKKKKKRGKKTHT